MVVNWNHVLRPKSQEKFRAHKGKSVCLVMSSALTTSVDMCPNVGETSLVESFKPSLTNRSEFISPITDISWDHCGNCEGLPCPSYPGRRLGKLRCGQRSQSSGPHESLQGSLRSRCRHRYGVAMHQRKCIRQL
jgi:hypothetical protein